MQGLTFVAITATEKKKKKKKKKKRAAMLDLATNHDKVNGVVKSRPRASGHNAYLKCVWRTITFMVRHSHISPLQQNTI